MNCHATLLRGTIGSDKKGFSQPSENKSKSPSPASSNGHLLTIPPTTQGHANVRTTNALRAVPHQHVTQKTSAINRVPT